MVDTESKCIHVQKQGSSVLPALHTLGPRTQMPQGQYVEQNLCDPSALVSTQIGELDLSQTNGPTRTPFTQEGSAHWVYSVPPAYETHQALVHTKMGGSLCIHPH